MARGKRPIKNPNKLKAGRKLVGENDRKIDRQRRVMEMRQRGLTLDEISHHIGTTESRVSQILKEVRTQLEGETKAIVTKLRDDAAARHLAVIHRWLPVALQPLKMSKVHKVTAEGSQLVDEAVFNEPAVQAVNALLKAESNLAKLMGMNLEQGGGESVDPQTLLMWIHKQVIIENVSEKTATGKTIDVRVERFGKLELPAGDQI